MMILRPEFSARLVTATDRLANKSSATMTPAFIAVTVLAILWLVGLEHRDLFDPDEGRYAEIAREMLRTGDWITPRLNGIPYFEKPPLQYWITAGFFELFGIGRWTARLWPALCGLMTIALVMLSTRRICDARGGLMAGFALAGTPLFFAFSQTVTLDLGVTFFLTLVMSSFLAIHDSRLSERRRTAWALLLWAAMALAVLSKGLIGVALPGLTLVLYCVVQRDLSALKRLHWGPGIIVFAVIAAPWFVLAQARHPPFLEFFVLHEHIARFTQAAHKRPGAWYFFPAVLALGTLPWAVVFARSLNDALRARTSGPLWINAPRLLALWVLGITGFFMMSSSKLPAYVLPVLPALAILMGWSLRRVRGRGVPKIGIGMLVIGGLIVGLAPWAQRLPRLATIEGAGAPLTGWLVLAGLLLALTGVFSARMIRRPTANVMFCAFGTVVAMQAIQMGVQSVASVYSSAILVAAARERANGFDTDARFYSVGMYDQSLVLQIDRLVTLVAYEDEFSFGLKQEPHWAISDLADFRQKWIGSSQAYAMLPTDRVALHADAGLPFVVLASNGREAIIARTAAQRAQPEVIRP